MQNWDVVVVGTGIAGVSATRTFARARFPGRVLLVNGEPVLPYKRTKLSKHITDWESAEQYALEEADWYDANRVRLVTGVSVESIDRDERTVVLSDGSVHGYGSVILAVGAAPVFPPVIRPHDASSFCVVRSAADLDRLSRDVVGAGRILIDGMGVLAVEVAEQCTRLGKNVTLVGAGGQIMPRQLNARAGELIEDLLRANGVELRFQDEILSFERRDRGGFTATMIRDSLVADLIVLCIGVAPRIDLAAASGLATNRGILVDEYLRTSDPAIYAVGDCAEHANGVVTELWHAAEYQGMRAAENVMGEAVGFDNPPFRLKCEVFGSYFFSANKPSRPLDLTAEESEHGERYRCLYFDGDFLSGAVMVNDRDRAAVYQQAVRERWSRAEVSERLPDGV